VESEDDFCFSDGLRLSRGLTGDTLSTQERFEKRDEDEEGREKLRTTAEGAKSFSSGGLSSGVPGWSATKALGSG
jgi:hypothetical protein